ncbi:MAG: bacterial Ig-like domain-containing protein [Clostridiales bacterium]|nr:bacterial Ig-like domain-containing protein [Clostridiales bacterium]
MLNTKNLLSLFLALLFALPGLGGLSMTAYAHESTAELTALPDKTTAAPGGAVTYTESDTKTVVPGVSFYVPEAVYLKTGDNGTQWYLNSCGDNGQIPPAAKDTTGKLYFHCDGATQIRITASGAGVVDLITAAAGDTVADNDFRIAAVSEGLLTYTAVYVAGGMERTAKAYTYIYEPNRVPTGCATEAQSDEHGGNLDCHGILTALWGAQSSDLKENISDANGADIADESIWLGNRGLTASQNNMPRSSGMVSAGKGTFGAQNSKSKNLSIASPTAYFYVDVSRFTNMKDIPNMYVGLTQTDCAHTDFCKLTAYLAAGHTSGQTAPASIASIIPETKTQTGTVIRQEGECVIDCDISAIQPDSREDYTVFTYGFSCCNTDGNEYTTNSYQHTHFRLCNSDKSDLRELLQSELSKNYIRQESFYTSGWEDYDYYMRIAASVLGDPCMTYQEVTNFVNTLQQVISCLEGKAPAITRAAVRRDGALGYFVYAQVEPNGGAPIDRVQFPTWTEYNEQDDIQKNWETNPAASGAFGVYSVDGLDYNYMYYVDVNDHNGELGEYFTRIYAYNALETYSYLETDGCRFTFTASFKADGKPVGEVQFAPGATSIKEPAVPEKEGYAGAWPSYKLGAQDITIEAVYTPNTYTVNWVADGKTTSIGVTFGAAIPQPAVPQKDGYTFTGWTPQVHVAMPAHDLTFTAKFEKTVVTVTGLTVRKRPDKNVYTYRVDANLDISGLELEAAYSDGSVKAVDPAACNITGYCAKPAGEKTITVKYEGQTAQFKVTVKYAWWQRIIRILLFGFIWY